mgnify:CR=1 FL=1
MNYMYSNMQQQMARPAYPNSGLYSSHIRPVSSLEEVRASVIDFDGSVFYFPDTANKKTEPDLHKKGLILFQNHCYTILIY